MSEEKNRIAKHEGNGAQPPAPLAPEPLSQEIVLAAMLHSSRERSANLELELGNVLAANAQLAGENARLTQELAKKSIAMVELENEKLRETYKFPLGATLQKNKKTGEFSWGDPRPAQA